MRCRAQRIIKERGCEIGLVRNGREGNGGASRTRCKTWLKCAHPFLAWNCTKKNLRLARHKALHAFLCDRLFHFGHERGREHAKWNAECCGIDVFTRKQNVDRLFQSKDLFGTLLDREVAIAER